MSRSTLSSAAARPAGPTGVVGGAGAGAAGSRAGAVVRNSFVPSGEKVSDPPVTAQPFRWPGVSGPSTSVAGAGGSGPLTARATVKSDANPPSEAVGSRPTAVDFAARSQTNTRHFGGTAAGVQPTGRGG